MTVPARDGTPQGEEFRYLAHRFDVGTLLALIRDGKVDARDAPCPVRPWAEACQIHEHERRPDGSWGVTPSHNLLLAAHVDMAYAEGLPEDALLEPILFVLLPPIGDKPGRPLLVDGHHRLAKAFLLGRDTVPARVVAPETLREAAPWYECLRGEPLFPRRRTAKGRKVGGRRG